MTKYFYVKQIINHSNYRRLTHWRGQCISSINVQLSGSFWILLHFVRKPLCRCVNENIRLVLFYEIVDILNIRQINFDKVFASSKNLNRYKIKFMENLCDSKIHTAHTISVIKIQDARIDVHHQYNCNFVKPKSIESII